MATDIDIASQALLLLRANTISSFSDDSNEAEIVNTMYEDFVQQILTLHPWTFATKKRLLNQDSTDPVNEYTYSHVIPGEALLLWAVFDSDEVGAKPVRDYDIYGVEGGRRIFSDYPELYADYTVYTDEPNWPSYFVQFAIHAFAAHIAIPVTHNTALAEYYERKAYGSANANRKGGLLGVAMSTDSKQKRNEYIVSSPLVEARFS
jgi:hypothetical protein